MKTIELKHPIKLKDNEIKYLTPTRLKLKHVKLLPAALMEKAKEEGKLKFETSELLPLFNDLVPFLASIFNISEEEMEEVDFEDIEDVMGAMEEIMPDDKKKA